jgi:HEPN domain-containing protein
LEEGIDASTAMMIHARQYLDDSLKQENFATTRTFLAVNAAELALKAVYYSYRPDGAIKGHTSRQLVGNVCHVCGIPSEEKILQAAENLDPHYDASRYPKETSQEFCCASFQVGCWHYPDVIDSLVGDAKLIVEWSAEHLKK